MTSVVPSKVNCRRHADGDQTAWLDGQEAHAHVLHHGVGARDHEDGDGDDDPAVVERPIEHLAVGHGGELVEEAGLGILLRLAELEEPRAEHRRERKADQQRDADGEGGGVAEARHEAADDAGHDGDGDEDDDERERGGEHGQADLAGALGGGFHGGHVLLFHVAEDIFQHDDGFVDDDAHHKGEGEHGDLVEREAHHVEQREGGDDGRGDGDGGDERGAPTADEQHDNNAGEDAA